MSINSKNLHYEKQEPAFLRRIRAGQAGLDGRHNVQIARPKKDRLKTGDDDDDPVIVDESGDVVGKEEWEGRLKRDETGEDDSQKSPTSQSQLNNHTAKEDGNLDGQREQPQKVVEAGASRKRKQVRVIGGNGEEDVEDANSKKGETSSNQPTSSGAKKAADPVVKKKSKKIKLSFDEPE